MADSNVTLVPGGFGRDRRSTGKNNYSAYQSEAGAEALSGNQYFTDVEVDVFGRGQTADSDPAVNIVATVREDSAVNLIGPDPMRIELLVDGNVVDTASFDIERGETRFAPGLGYTFEPSQYGSSATITVRLTNVNSSTVTDEVTQSISVPGEAPDNGGDSGGDNGGDNNDDGSDPDNGDDPEQSGIIGYWESLSDTEKLVLGLGGAAAGFALASGGGGSGQQTQQTQRQQTRRL